MDQLSSFVPIDRRLALAQGRSLPDPVAGAVLFADLSGFTPFTELLDRELGHKLGAEALNRHLDPVWATLVNQVHAFAGSVISFSGDGITCLFADYPIVDLGPIDRGLRRAVSCALAIQAEMGQYATVRTSGQTTVSLSVKLAVAGGTVRRFAIGLPNTRMFELVAGAVVDRVAAAEQLLKAGEVGVGAEAFGQFGQQLVVDEWREGPGHEYFGVVKDLSQPTAPSPWPAAPSVPDEVARQWVPGPVVERLQRTGGEFLSELRPVVSMMLSFQGVDYEADPAAVAKLSQFVGWVQATLARYEGNLLQVTVGDKGSYCHAAFGALVAHEDDARRAVEAALNLRVMPASLDFIQPVRIGLSRGTMYVGAYGSREYHTFGAQGRETNVAARLMSAAEPGQLLVTPHLAEAAGDRFAFRQLGSMPLKGLANPVPILMVESRHWPAALASYQRVDRQPLVGRQRELAILARHLDALDAGQSSTLAILGEAGSGKSRLLSAGLDLARRRGRPILFGSGDAVEQMSSYSAWSPIFRQILEVGPEARPAAVSEKILAGWAGEPALRERAPLLDAVLPGTWEDNELTGQMVGEARASSTRDLLVEILKRYAVSSHGLVLAMEDANWLDSASWQLLAQARVGLAATPMLLIVAARNQVDVASSHPELSALLSAPEVEQLHLGRLTYPETVDLIRSGLGAADVAEPVARWVYQQADGHPFFSEQLVYALRDAGYIKIENGRARLTDESKDLHELDFPVELQGVITSRIDRLDATGQLALKVASVVGQIFAFRLLRDVFPIPADKDLLPEYLLRIERLDLILKSALEPELLYTFKHSITQEVVYSLLTVAQRRQLHRNVAEWLEAHVTDDPGALYPVLAHHWSQTEAVDRAITYAEKAGERASANFANEEAVYFFSQALRLDTAAGQVSDPRRRAQWELQIGEALVHWTRYVDGRTHLEAGLRLLGMPALPAGSRPGNVLRLLGPVVRQGLHRLWPNRYLGSRRDEAAALRAASRALTRLVEVYYHLGEIMRSTHAAFYALNLAELAGDSVELAEAYPTIASFFTFLNLHRTGQAYFQRALATAERTNSQAALLYIYLVLCTYESGQGRLQQARAASDRLMTISRRLGAKRRYNDGLQLSTIILYLHGEFAACRERAGELLTSARSLRDRRFEGYGLFAQAFSWLHEGRMWEAQAALDQLSALFSPEAGLKDTQLELNTNGLLALARLRQGDDGAALAAAARAIGLSSAGVQLTFYALLTGYAGPAEVYLSLWEREGLPAKYQPAARRALDMLKRHAGTFPIGRPSAGLLQGQYEWLSGARARALRTWQVALAVARQLDMPYEEARLAYELGARQPGDSRAAEHVRHACDIFERLGAADALQRARAALQALEARIATAAE